MKPLRDTKRMRNKIRAHLLEVLASSHDDAPIEEHDLFLAPHERDLTLKVMDDLINEGQVLEITCLGGAPSGVLNHVYEPKPHWWLASRPMRVRGGHIKEIPA